jgi:DHA3 family tetracycline resistance protein-like MFS transporter
MHPLTLYLILEFASALLFWIVFTASDVYLVTVAQLDPLQLVLVGTTLESTIFVFEIPTGVLADVKSRRLSIIIGYAVMGAGFIVQGALPFFWAVLLAQLLWGLGYTFTSGATQAWVADELGEEEAGPAFMRGTQFARIGGLAGIPISLATGILGVQAPIIIGGALMVGLALFLTAVMGEEGFNPTPTKDRTTWSIMLQTVRDARKVVLRRPTLLILMAIGLFYGLYSEGFDRLWAAHLLQNYTLPLIEVIKPIFWFSIIKGVRMGIGILATEIARRRVDTVQGISMARILLLNGAGIVLALVGFGLSPNLWLAILLYWLIQGIRTLNWPLYTSWFNLQIDDPRVRATMFSVSSQVDAIGQIAGGPAIGVVGNRSIRAALVTSALLLTPVIPLYGIAIGRGKGNRSWGEPASP